MALHPKGDNLIIGSYDSRLNWFDLDLSAKPYKTLRYAWVIQMPLPYPMKSLDNHEIVDTVMRSYQK